MSSVDAKMDGGVGDASLRSLADKRFRWCGSWRVAMRKQLSLIVSCHEALALPLARLAGSVRIEVK